MVIIKSPTTVSSAIPPEESFLTLPPNSAEPAPLEPNLTPQPKHVTVNVTPPGPSTLTPKNANAVEVKFGLTMIANAQTISHSGTERNVSPVQLEPLSSQRTSNVTIVQKDSKLTQSPITACQLWDTENDLSLMLFL